MGWKAEISRYLIDAPPWLSTNVAIELLMRFLEISAEMFEIAYLQQDLGKIWDHTMRVVGKD